MAEEKKNPHIRFLGQAAAATVLWVGTFVATKSAWLGQGASLSMRIALVAVGLAGFLPIVFVYGKSIRLQDEFNQRIHYVALSIAFAATAVVSYGCDLLAQAGFIPPLPSTGLWALMFAIWFITMILTPRFYR